MKAPELCVKCGGMHVTKDGHQACTGHSSRHDGRGCQSPPIKGLDVCRVHGGATRRSRDAAARRVSEGRATALMRQFGGPVDTTATEALLDTVKWTAGFVAWLRNVVEQLDVDELGWGTAQIKSGGEDWGTTEKASSNVHVAMLGDWTDRLVKVCAAALSAGVEERRVRVAEQQGALVADVIKRVLGELNLTPEQQAVSGEVVVRHLRLLTA